MPIHLNDLDVVPQVAGLHSALIVPCNMCPAVTVAVREDKPLIQFFRGFFKSAPFEKHIRALQTRLREKGVKTKVFRNNLYHHWFLCMWTSGRRKKLQKYAKQYEAVIVLGCESATETVRELVESVDCKVVQGMEVTGFMNAKPRFRLPFNITFEDCKIIPMSRQEKDESASA
jgi:acetyl esterase/lipase